MANPAGGRGQRKHPLVERARHVLAHEQRTGHQDAAVKPGGLETFIRRWSEEARAARERQDGLPLGPDGRPAEDTLAQALSGYAALDPMRRAAQIRRALALLDTLAPGSTTAVANAAPVAARSPIPERREPGRNTTAARHEPPRFGSVNGRKVAPAGAGGALAARRRRRSRLCCRASSRARLSRPSPRVPKMNTCCKPL